MRPLILPSLMALLTSAAPLSEVVAEDVSLPLDGWVAEGAAFRQPLCTGELLRRLEIENAGAATVLSSEREGDGPQGTLTSPEFDLTRQFVAFRIGGGDFEWSTCLQLMVDGRVVRQAAGWNSDSLHPQAWDVSAWRGRKARLRLVDAASGGWGHVNVSRLLLTDAPEVRPQQVPPLYQEALRPQFHFTARQWTMTRLNPGQRQEGWINDLNGLIFYEGEFHLFAQRWAKCWLHAVSRDLIHWEELEPAFWEESLGSGVQSGHCVVDYDNTSGLSPDPGTPPLVAFWSRFDNRSQCLSFSLDRGRTWQPYAKNPFMERPERDPKVFWHEPSRRWVMLLYGQRQYHFFTSENLLDWRDEESPLPDCFECPDFFELPVEGKPGESRWALIHGDGRYELGRFDGRRFTAETPRRLCDVGPHFYATQSWHNNDASRGGDGRRIQAAWMRGADFPDMPFSQMISFPCQLTLHEGADGLRLHRRPIAELARLHQAELTWSRRTLPSGEALALAPDGQALHLRAQLSIPQGARLTLDIRGATVVLTHDSLENGHAPATVTGFVNELEVLIDRTSIEVFVNQGEISSTRFILPGRNGIRAKAEGGAVELISASLWPLNSIW
jgi:sucrose-6-phosphate hydrolase SacC (GH32 family)